MKKSSVIFRIAIVAIIICVLIIILDYSDLFYRMGVSTATINYDLESIVINTITTILLFLLAYFLVDRWNKKQYENKRDIALELMKETYQECKKYVKILDKSVEGKILIEKKNENIKGKSEYLRYFTEYENNPFQTHEYIMQFCTDGIIEV